MKSKKARKQRKNLFNAPVHKKRRWMASHLEENLLLKYDRRAMPVVTGDTVKVMRGIFKGHEDKVSHVNVNKRYVEIEGLTLTKADGKKIAKPIHPSNLTITKMILTDNWRRKKLERGLSEEAKKEIEKEAKEQIRELEEEEKRIEEEMKEKELEEPKDSTMETEEEEETVKKVPPETIEETVKEEKTKKEEAKEEPKAEKKPVEKKVAKKTSTKPSTKKVTTAKKTSTKKKEDKK